MIKLMIFDMDGTIIDSDQVLINTWKELFSLYKHGESFDPNKIAEYSGPPLSYAINDAFKDYEDKEFIRKEYRSRTKKYYDTDLSLFKHARKALKFFHDNNIKLCVLTAKNSEMTAYCLKKFCLFSYFDELITCDSNFEPKPCPDAIIYLKEKYKLNKDEIMMVGDTYYDALAGINADVQTALMTMRYRVNLDSILDKVTLKAKSYDDLVNFIKLTNDLK